MAIEFVLFTSEWEAAVARFNDRMRAGNAPTAFGLPSRAGTPRGGLVHARHYLAVEGTEVRGGILILEHPATINDTTPLGGGARRETVINLQSPLSEAIIDSKYAMVSIQLIRFALKRCPYAYVVGMGSAENPLPRLLKASGWTVRPVPFCFRILRAARCLRQLKPLQRKPALNIAALVGAATGTGALALWIVQRFRTSANGYRAERVVASDRANELLQHADDTLWSTIEQRISFGVVRDSSTLAAYLWPQVERYRVYRGSECCGWFTLLLSSMRDHAYFGNLRVATVVDVIAPRATDLGAIAVLAVECAQAANCDLVVSNQLHEEARDGLRSAGFLSFSSNYLFATSKALSAAIRDATSIVSRQDGDGLVNLRGADPVG